MRSDENEPVPMEADDEEVTFSSLDGPGPRRLSLINRLLVQTRRYIIPLTLLSCLVLGVLLWPTATTVFNTITGRNQAHLSPKPTPTVPSSFQRGQIPSLYTNILHYKDMLYISTINFNQQPVNGTLAEVQAATGRLLWRYSGSITNMPQIIQDSLYIQNETGLTALSLVTHRVLWHVEDQGLIIDTTESTLLISGKNGFVSLRTRDGSRVWQTSGSDEWRVDQHILYLFDGQQRAFRAIRSDDGSQVWQKPLVVKDLPNTWNIEDGVLFYTDEIDGQVRAVRSSDASAIWHTLVGTSALILSADNAVLVVESGLQVKGLRLSDGRQLWMQRFEGTLFWRQQGLLVDVEDQKSMVQAWKTDSGQKLWQIQLPLPLDVNQQMQSGFDAQHSIFYLSDIELGTTVVVPAGTASAGEPPIRWYSQSNASLFAIDASTGKTLWMNSGNGDGVGSIVDDDSNNLYVMQEDGAVFALEKQRGLMRWAYRPIIPVGWQRVG